MKSEEQLTEEWKMLETCIVAADVDLAAIVNVLTDLTDGSTKEVASIFKRCTDYLVTTLKSLFGPLLFSAIILRTYADEVRGKNGEKKAVNTDD